MKKLILLISLFIFSFTLSACDQSKHTAKAEPKQKQTNQIKIVKESFVVTKAQNGEYEAVNVHKSKDKPKLLFTVDDIKGNKNIKVNNKIIAYYAARKGEDAFIYVKKEL